MCIFAKEITNKNIIMKRIAITVLIIGAIGCSTNNNAVMLLCIMILGTLVLMDVNKKK